MTHIRKHNVFKSVVTFLLTIVMVVSNIPFNYTQVFAGSTIRVLNITPDGSTLGQLAEVVSQYDKVGEITVTTKTVDQMNASPDGILKPGGNYAYDVIAIGFKELNGGNSAYNGGSGKRPTEATRNAIQTFMDQGGSVLFGHDTLADKDHTIESSFDVPFYNKTDYGDDWQYAKLRRNAGIALTSNVAFEAHRGNYAKVVKQGSILTYPYNIPKNAPFMIATTHTNGAMAKGDVWIQITEAGGNLSTANMGTGDLVSSSYHSNYYLTTYNNTATIQYGHLINNVPQMFPYEGQIIINTLYHLGGLSNVSTYTVSGTVKDSASPYNVISGVTVNIGGKTATTNSSGYYSIAGLTGNQTITVNHNGYNAFTKSIAINSNMTQDISLTKTTYTVSGTVKDSASPYNAISGVTVNIGGKTATTNSSGYYSIVGLTGSQTINVNHNGYNAFTQSIQINSNMTQDISLTKPTVTTYTVSGTVKDSASPYNAISGVTVNIGGKTATTNSSGYYSIAGLTGNQTITVSHNGYNAFTKSIAINSNMTQDISLTKPTVTTYTVSGTVKDSASPYNAISGVTVNIGGKTATTNSAGYYSIAGLTGNQTITVSHNGYNAFTKSIAINSNMTQDISLTKPTVTTYTVSGTVKDSASPYNAISGVTVNIGGKTATTNSAGYYSIAGLTGSQTITVNHNGYNAFTQSIQINSNMTQDISLTKTSVTTYTVSGTVRDSASPYNVISGVDVTISGITATTNSSGYYSIAGLTNGVKTLNTNRAGYDAYGKAITINNSNMTQDISLTKTSVTTYTVSGTVRDSASPYNVISGVDVTISGITATTNSSGYYSIGGLTNGVKTLNTNRAGYDAYGKAITINNSNMTQDISLTKTSVTTYTVSGTVRDSASPYNVISGVDVTISGITATTNSSGYYSIGGLTNGVKTLTTNRTGYVAYGKAITINNSNITHDISLVKVTSGTGKGTISGYVYDQNNNPLANATVATLSGLSAVTNGSGYYQILNVNPGTYAITAKLTGYNSDYGLVTVVKNQTTSKDFILSSKTVTNATYIISGKVTDEASVGLSAANVKVAIGVVAQDNATTDSFGYYVSKVGKKVYILTASKAGYDSNTARVDARSANADINRDFILTQGMKIEVTVVDSSNQPISDAYVLVDGQIVFTDTSGKAIVKVNTAGDYEVFANKAGYSPGNGNVSVTAGTAITPIKIVMKSPSEGTIWGYVYDETDNPLEGATVSTVSTEAGLTGSALTDTWGYYYIDGVTSNKPYAMIAEKSGYNSDANTFTLDSNFAGQNFQLTQQNGTNNRYVITGKVTDSASPYDVISGVTVTIGAKTATTDSSGYYLIGGLTKGAKTIATDRVGYNAFSKSITINSDMTQDISLTKTAIPTYTVSGTVKDSASPYNAISGVTVNIGGKTATTNSVGYYSIVGLTGSQTITVNHNGYNPFSKSITINSDMTQDISLVKVTSGTGKGTISGYVYDQNNNPLANATVATLSGLSAVTNGSGYYQILNVNPGTYAITAELNGYNSDYGLVTVVKNQTTSKDFILSSQTISNATYLISGKVTDEASVGLSAANVKVAIGVVAQDNVTTDSFGYYVSKVGKKVYILTASKAGYDSNTARVDARSANADINQDFILTQGMKIEVTVVDSLNQPISDAYVLVDGQIVFTDTSGKAIVKVNTAGDYEVFANKAGYSPGHGNVSVTAGTAITPIKIVMKSPSEGTIWGYVYDETDNPLEGATVSTVSTEAGLTGSALTDTWGYYYIDGVTSNKSYAMIAEKSGYNSDANTFTLDSNFAGQNFKLTQQNGTNNRYVITGKVTDVDNGAAVVGANVTIKGVVFTTDSAGNFIASNYADNEVVQLDTTNGNYIPDRRNVTISGADADVNIPLKSLGANGAVKVFVEDASAQRITGATVKIAGTTATAVAGETGAYIVTAIPYGTHKVVASKNSYNPNDADVTLGAAPNNYKEVTIKLTSGNKGAVYGRVIDGADNSGVAGATVSTLKGNENASTDSTGYYFIKDLDAGSYSAIAKKSGYNSDVSVIDIVAGTNTTKDFTINKNQSGGGTQPESFVIWGTVKGNDGTSEVTLTGADVSDGTKTVKSDSFGLYALKGYVNNASYSLEASKAPYNKATKTGTIKGADKNEDFVLTTAMSIEVLVVDSSDSPISGANVLADGQKAITGVDGKVSISVSAFGDYVVLANKAGYATGNANATVTALNLKPQVKITLSSAAQGTIWGYVTDQDDNPLIDANVSTASTVAGSVGSALTDKFGYYYINSVTPNATYSMVAKKSGYNSDVKTVNLDSNFAGQNFKLTLQNGTVNRYVITGRVTDKDNASRGIEGAEITIKGVKFTTDSTGYYVASNYTDNESVSLLAEKAGYIPDASKTVTISGADAKVDIQLKSLGVNGTVKVHVVYDANLQPISGAIVKIAGKTATEIAGETGSYLVSNIPFGTYKAIATKATYNPNDVDVTLAAAPNNYKEVTIKLTAGNKGAVYGRVIDMGNNSGVPGATVRTIQGGNSATSDSDGYYFIKDLDEGVYSTIAEKTGYNSDAELVAITPGTTETQDFRINKNQSGGGTNPDEFVIWGRVKGTDGTTEVVLKEAWIMNQTSDIVVSDSFGYYVFKGFKNGSHNVWAIKDPYNSEKRVVAINNADKREDFLLTTEMSIGVTVVDSSNQPIRTASVLVNGQMLLTDVNGKVKVPVTEVGIYTVLAQKTGYAPAKVSVEVAGDIPNPTVQIVLKTTQDGAIWGQVTDQNSKPVVGAKVSTLSGLSEVTDEFGYYYIVDVKPDRYVMTAKKAGYNTDYATVVVPQQNITMQDFRLIQQNATNKRYIITGRVTVKGIGDAVDRANVFINDNKVFETDSNGYYVSPKYPNGNVRVRASHIDYVASANKTVTISNSDVVENIELESLGTNGTVRVFVKDNANGDPILDATVKIAGKTATAVAGVDGAYDVNNIPFGSYKALAIKDAYNPNEGDVTLGSYPNNYQEITIRLTNGSKGALYGRVVDGDDNSGVPTAIVTTLQQSRNAITDSAGYYIIKDLDVGSYTTTARKSGYNSDVSVVDIVASTDTNNDFTIYKNTSGGGTHPDSFIIWGSVKGSNGATTVILPGADVSEGSNSALTDTFGFYALKGYINNVNYSLTASKVTYTADTKTGTINGVDEKVDFVLTNSKSIEVSVVDSSDSPISDANVLVDGNKVITDATGKVNVPVSALGNYEVLVNKSSYAPGKGNVTVTALDNNPQVKIVLKTPSNGAILGYTLDQDDNALPGVTVATVSNVPGSTGSVVSDAFGYYYMEDVNPNSTYYVTASKNSYNSSYTIIDVPAVGFVAHDFKLNLQNGINNLYILKGRVTDKDDPSIGVVDATVNVSVASIGFTVPITTDSMGYYVSMGHIDREVVSIDTTHADYLPDSTSVTINNADTIKDIQLQNIGSKGVVKVYVVDDATSLPISTATVLIAGRSGVQVAGEVGAYMVSGIPFGTYRAAVANTAYNPIAVDVTLDTAPDNYKEITIRMITGNKGGAYGRVVDSFDNSGVTDATVRAVVAGKVGKTDSGGYYFITGLDAGSYLTTVTKSGYTATSGTLNIYPGQLDIVDFTIVKTTILIRGLIEDTYLDNERVIEVKGVDRATGEVLYSYNVSETDEEGSIDVDARELEGYVLEDGQSSSVSVDFSTYDFEQSVVFYFESTVNTVTVNPVLDNEATVKPVLDNEGTDEKLTTISVQTN